MPARTITIGECVITIDDDARRLVTRFPDGSELPATGNADPESVARAHDLGHAGDTWAMSRDHEIAHSFLAARAGRPCSPTLYHAANPDSPVGADPEERLREECRVLTFQRFVTSGDNRRDCVFWLNNISKDIDALALDFQSLVGGSADSAATGPDPGPAT
jgi:hypothetical protein